MKRVFIALILGSILMFTACGNAAQDTESTKKQEQTAAADERTAEEKVNMETAAAEKSEATSEVSQSKEVSVNQDDYSVYYGTWDIDSVEIKGSKYTADEVKAMGDESLDGLRIVIKEGGSGCIHEKGGSTIFDWEGTPEGIKLGVKETTLSEDGLLILKHNGNLFFFRKTSDDQTIKAEEDEPAEEPEAGDDAEMAFSPQDVSDDSIESIQTYGDYLVMYEMIINDYLANYEAVIKDTVLYDEASFQEMKDEMDEAFAEQEKKYGSMRSQRIIGKDALVEYLKIYRDTLQSMVDLYADMF